MPLECHLIDITHTKCALDSDYNQIQLSSAVNLKPFPKKWNSILDLLVLSMICFSLSFFHLEQALKWYPAEHDHTSL